MNLERKEIVKGLSEKFCYVDSYLSRKEIVMLIDDICEIASEAEDIHNVSDLFLQQMADKKD